MEKCSIDRERAIVTGHQMTEIPEPGEGPLHQPTPLVAPKNATILWWGPAPVQAQGRDQRDTSPPQPLSQGVTVISFVRDHPQWFLPRKPSVMPSTYADLCEGLLGEADFRRGCRVQQLLAFFGQVAERQAIKTAQRVTCVSWPETSL